MFEDDGEVESAAWYAFREVCADGKVKGCEERDDLGLGNGRCV